jgi:hypothetical protein
MRCSRLSDGFILGLSRHLKLQGFRNPILWICLISNNRYLLSYQYASRENINFTTKSWGLAISGWIKIMYCLFVISSHSCCNSLRRLVSPEFIQGDSISKDKGRVSLVSAVTIVGWTLNESLLDFRQGLQHPGRRGPPSLLANRYLGGGVVTSQGIKRQRRELVIHLHLVQRLRIRGAISRLSRTS